MSIIHDALKKVQQGLTPKKNEKDLNPEVPVENIPANLYATPVPAENLPTPAGLDDIPKKSPRMLYFKNVMVLCTCMAVIAGSGYYLYQQYRTNILQAKNVARKSFYKLIHKEEIPDFKTKTPEELKPLAKLTINASKTSSPMTLNIHGIMANGGSNLVLINDQVYQEGDEVDGAKIIKINLDSITVNVDGAEQTIFVKS
jgi:hypothetical protein